MSRLVAAVTQGTKAASDIDTAMLNSCSAFFNSYTGGSGSGVVMGSWEIFDAGEWVDDIVVTTCLPW